MIVIKALIKNFIFGQLKYFDNFKYSTEYKFLLRFVENRQTTKYCHFKQFYIRMNLTINYYQNRCLIFIQICNIFHNMTAAPRRTSQTQMADINAQLANQNETLRNMLKVANQTDVTTNNIQAQLKRQREVLQNNVEKNKQIKHEVKKADKKTAEMRRRNLCVKAVLWIVILLLFATNIGLIIWKATGKSPI